MARGKPKASAAKACPTQPPAAPGQEPPAADVAAPATPALSVAESGASLDSAAALARQQTAVQKARAPENTGKPLSALLAEVKTEQGSPEEDEEPRGCPDMDADQAAGPSGQAVPLYKANPDEYKAHLAARARFMRCAPKRLSADALRAFHKSKRDKNALFEVFKTNDENFEAWSQKKT